MLKKLLAFLSIAATMTATAQDRLGLLEIQAPTVVVGTYWERMDYDGRHLDDYHWGTAYLDISLETGKWNGLSLGAALLSHGQVYKSEQGADTDGDGIYDYAPFDSDIEPQDKVSLKRFYLQYEMNNLLVQVGRIGRKLDGRKTHLDDNTYEGLMGKFDVNENIALLAGAIMTFGEKDYDDAEDLTQVDTLNRGAGDYVFFGHAYADIAKVYEISPFTYYHEDYATVYGLDNKVTLGKEDSLTFGALANVNMIDSKLNQVDDSKNIEVAVFAETKLAGGKLSAQVGQIKFDGNGGNDPAMLKPAWMEDYMYHCDQTQWNHSNELQDGLVNYVTAKFVKDMFGRPCWAQAYLGRTDYEDENNRDQHIELRELWLGCDFTKSLKAYIKLIDAEHKTHIYDYGRIELRVEYTF